jgi:hypothetical protein
MGKRFGMALIAGTLGLSLAGAALADDTKTTLSDKGLAFSAGDAFSLKVSNFLQQRFTVSDNRDDFGAGAATPRDSATFSVVRFETGFNGNVWDKKWVYSTNIRWINLNAASGAGVENAYVGYESSDSFKWYMGRAKVDFASQETTSSKNQQFADRSAANAAFTMGHGTGSWFKGSQKVGDNNRFNYSVGLYNGGPVGVDQNDEFSNGGGNNNVEFGMMANLRASYVGNAGDNMDVTKGESDLRKDDASKDLTYMVGAAVNLMQLHRTESPVARAGEVWNATLDARVFYRGVSINAALFHRAVNFDVDKTSGLPGGYTDRGAYLALGYNMNMASGDQVEVAARVSMINHDDDINGAAAGSAAAAGVGNANDSSEYGLALNYRLHGDALKFTFDVNYLEARQHKVVETVPTVTWRFQMQFMF